jgi:hypothetical protein
MAEATYLGLPLSMKRVAIVKQSSTSSFAIRITRLDAK